MNSEEAKEKTKAEGCNNHIPFICQKPNWVFTKFLVSLIFNLFVFFKLDFFTIMFAALAYVSSDFVRMNAFCG